MASGGEKINNNLNTDTQNILPMTILGGMGQYIDSSAFTLEDGKIRCALDGAVYAETTANASSAQANGWIKQFILFEYPDGTSQAINVAHARTSPTVNEKIGVTVHGNTFRSVFAGTLVSTYLLCAQGGATLGNTYWLKIGYLYVPVNE